MQVRRSSSTLYRSAKISSSLFDTSNKFGQTLSNIPTPQPATVSPIDDLILQRVRLFSSHLTVKSLLVNSQPRNTCGSPPFFFFVPSYALSTNSTSSRGGVPFIRLDANSLLLLVRQDEGVWASRARLPPFICTRFMYLGFFSSSIIFPVVARLVIA